MHRYRFCIRRTGAVNLLREYLFGYVLFFLSIRSYRLIAALGLSAVVIFGVG